MDNGRRAGRGPGGKAPFGGAKKWDKARGQGGFPKGKRPDKPAPHAPRPSGAPRPPMGSTPRPAGSTAATGPDARRVALGALSEVTRVRAYSTLALDEHLRRARNLSIEDKRLATIIFYAALENRIRIAWVLKQFVKSIPEPVIEDILHIATAQILFLDRVPDHAAVDEAVKQTKSFGREHFSALVNGTLRSLIRARDAGEIDYPSREEEPVKYISVMHSLPVALAERLIADFGYDEAEALIAFHPSARVQTVRPNLTLFDDDAFAAYLQGRGLTFERGIVPHAFRLSGAGDLGSDPDFKRGQFSIQGEGSMLAALAVAPRRAENILDACAAPGGKAALLCEMMGLTGRVQAWELHEHRAELMRAMKKRLKLDNMRVMVRDASIKRAECEESFDAVLIDAPCTGLGVMVNKPDIKYRVTEEDIASLVEVQAKILDACADYPRVGGRLVYSTCSVLKDENERQVQAFLKRHPNYALDPSPDYVPDALRAHFDGGMVQLLPNRDGIEGFFIARLTRVSI